MLKGLRYMYDIINFKSKLREKGLRFTEQREAILDTVYNNQDKHLSSQEIYERVRNFYPEVGIATVYRTLALLEEMDIIYSSDFGDGLMRYEVVKEGEKHRHHHLVCDKCGRIIEVERDLLSSIEKWIDERYSFKVKNHRVKFYGQCEQCRKK